MRKVVAAALLFLAACAGPTTVVRSVDTRPALAVSGAPAGAVLYVDGQRVGDARAYDGQPNILRVEPGTHEVELRDGAGAVVFRQRVFVESELKTVKVH
ncbi:MAG TPA: hypothetical protein VIW03_15210 [Anaeromyxobacter sp.]